MGNYCHLDSRNTAPLVWRWQCCACWMGEWARSGLVPRPPVDGWSEGTEQRIQVWMGRVENAWILIETNLKLFTFIILLFCNLSFRFVSESSVLLKHRKSHTRRLRLWIAACPHPNPQIFLFKMTLTLNTLQNIVSMKISLNSMCPSW